MGSRLGRRTVGIAFRSNPDSLATAFVDRIARKPNKDAKNQSLDAERTQFQRP
ncbi:MAG TPA: hypothetical protein VEI46_00325 [Thermodesulfovibrionales bacterium]|nr:hypothetical protein [Thermodesulfovibrionales bacterium]